MKIQGRRNVSIQEAADFYGVTTRTVRRWIAEGRLTAYRINARVIRLDADEVENLPRRIPTR